MREVQNQIPMGNSNPTSSEARMLQLYVILREAFVELSGEQQNGGMGFPYNDKAGRKAKVVIEDAVRDIAMGLTGLQIRFRRGRGKTTDE